MIEPSSESVLVIGASSSDIKGRASNTLQRGTSNAGVVRRSLGGVARNIAENLARLDLNVTLLTAVGDDHAGRQIMQLGDDLGIDMSPSLVVEGGHTGAYIAVVDETGQLSVAIDDMSVSEAITPRYVNDRRRLFAEAAMLVVDGNLSPATLQTIFGLALKHQLPICVDPTSTALAERFCGYLRNVRLIAPNVEEAARLTDKPPARTPEDALDVARGLVAAGVRFAILTLGEQGTAYATPNESGHVPAMHVEVVDPSGAGDALTAAVIFAAFNHIPAPEAVRLGIAAATLTLQSEYTVRPDLSLEKLYEQLAA